MKIHIIVVLTLLTYSLNAQGIRQDGGYLVNSGIINLSSDFGLRINDTLNSQSNSQISFEGNAQQDIQGSGNLNFYNIRMNNSSAGVQLHSDANLSGTLFMVVGDFDLLDQELNLGSLGAVSGENTNSMIKATDGTGSYTAGNDAGDGRIINTVSIGTSGLTNVAGLGIDVTPVSNWGASSVWRDHQQVVGVQNDLSVFRKYTIAPTNASNLQANISIEYNASELNGNSSGSLKMYQLKDNGAKGVEWEELTSTDNGSKVSATSNDNNLSELTVTLAGTGSVLPVSLLSFSSYCDGELVRIQWKTASELNNDYFIIEKSEDGTNYSELIRVNGQGNSNTLSEYEYLDYNGNGTTFYYRLTQVDYDGKTKVYDPIVSQCGLNTDLSFKVVNPAKNSIIILADQDLNQEIDIYLYDMGGKLLYTKSMGQNKRRWLIPAAQFEEGVYQLVFRGKSFIETKPVILIKE